MIKNNLAVILAERNLKIGDVHEATGISRNTLSSFVNSKANGIQYDTLNKLCEFLDLEPGDILTHIKFKINVISKEEKSPFLMKYNLEISLHDEKINTTISVEQKPVEETNSIIEIKVKIPPSVFNKLSIIPKDYIVAELTEKAFESIMEYHQSETINIELSKLENNEI